MTARPLLLQRRRAANREEGGRRRPCEREQEPPPRSLEQGPAAGALPCRRRALGGTQACPSPARVGRPGPCPSIHRRSSMRHKQEAIKALFGSLPAHTARVPLVNQAL